MDAGIRISSTDSNAAVLAGMPLETSLSTFILYIGCYTGHGNKGIHAFRFKTTDGDLQPLGLAAEAVNPSALVLVPSNAGGNIQRMLAVRETSKAGDGMDGAILSYIVDQSSGTLQLVDEAPSHGDGPCSVALDESGRHVLVANFWGGTVAVLPLLRDGRFGKASAVVQNHGHSVHPERQTGPHPHDLRTMPGSRFAVVADLGMDQLLIFRFDSKTGRIVPAEIPSFQMKAGAGPRRITFSQNGSLLYVVNEIDCTVDVISVDRDTGNLKRLQTVATMNNDLKQPGDAAGILLHPSGRFLYTSTRQTSTIRLFQVDEVSGTLIPVHDFSTGGQCPSTFALDPSGRWLIAGNQISNNVALFPIDLSTGMLGRLQSSFPINTPSGFVFVPSK
jgi:6-phosphogluconolactonase